MAATVNIFPPKRLSQSPPPQLAAGMNLFQCVLTPLLTPFLGSLVAWQSKGCPSKDTRGETHGEGAAVHHGWLFSFLIEVLGAMDLAQLVEGLTIMH